uniref:Uncharacterized protein n=1 Tax=Arundo donax TaxID=35708 RepID=A0A0A9FNH4_ARUDO
MKRSIELCLRFCRLTANKIMFLVEVVRSSIVNISMQEIQKLLLE